MASIPINVAFFLASVIVQASQPRVDVRVGIVAYEDFHGELEHFDQFFAELSQRDPTLQFQLAVGSYSDVLHWMDRQLIELAVLTPGAFVSVLPSHRGSSPAAAYAYECTIQLPAAMSTFAPPPRRRAGFHHSYRSVCLVAKSSPLRSVEELRRAVREGRAEVLFVHPMSVSGRIVPLEGLRRVGINLRDDQIRFTYSHTQSMRLLAADGGEKERVAFVWDDAAAAGPELEAQIRRLPFPELEELEIPHDVVVSRSDFAHADRVRLLLHGAESARYRFTALEDWSARFDNLRDWALAAGTSWTPEESQRISLEEIAQLLLHYSRSQPRPPRLALVLSGGGAKCSYQVGAVAALEERLARLRQGASDQGLDIQLVVGTSGGAINSLPVAMSISRSERGREAFRRTWQSLDQRDIVRPSLLIRANMGLWFAILQTAVVIWGVRRFVPDVERRGKVFVWAFTLLAALEVAVGYLPLSPWRLLGTNHHLHHAWLWLSFGIRASAWSLLAIGIGALALEATRRRRGRPLTIPVRLTMTTLLAGILGLPLLQASTILFYEETLSTGAGMEQALATRFPALINEHLADERLRPLDVKGSDGPAAKLRNVSRQVIERRLLKRDLVITGSCLAQTSEELPSDLYFYAAADPAAPRPPFGERGVPLAERPQVLLDVVMGSGSIFPVFPPRAILDIPRAGEHIELVDGGFAHNSPVEAAVLWGATHIVLIEATPRRRSARGNFLRNATSSFRHLHRQAQLLDTRSRGTVTIFSLAPEPPHICVLDFADNLITNSIQQGYRDATSRSGTSSFLRELGQPVFFPAHLAN